MIDLREVWAWFVFYFLASVLALAASIFSIGTFFPNEGTKERLIGPVEQRFYLLLVDKAYWLSGNSRDAALSEGMTKGGIENFSILLNEIRFTADCYPGVGMMVEQDMACVVNGKEINFVDHS